MILMTILGAFLWRLRGGLLNDLTGKANWLGFNDTVVRLMWSLGMAAAFIAYKPEYCFIFHQIAKDTGWLLLYSKFCMLGLMLLAGTTVVGWFGAALYPVKWRDIGLLSLSGFLRMIFPAIMLLSPWPLVAGLLFGPAYWVGARIPRWRAWMFWGEIICGAVIGACLALT